MRRHVDLIRRFCSQEVGLPDGFFESFAGPESWHRHFGNLDVCPGLRVNSATGGPLTEIECAKSGYRDFFAVFNGSANYAC